MRVLLVDDKAENRYLLTKLLQGHGFAVDEAAQGEQALELARQQPPDLVVSDLLMPGMDGYTLLRHWKVDAVLQRIPFVVYTATYTEPMDEQLALDMGADAFIVKPSEPDAFMARVQTVLKGAEQRAVEARSPSASEVVVLKMYNEVLVRKLEQRSLTLEHRLADLDAAHRRIVRLNRLYAALSETNQAIVYASDRDALFAQLCRIAVERGGMCMAWVGVISEETGEVVSAARCGEEPAWFARLSPMSSRGPVRTPVEWVLTRGEPYLCNDLFSDPDLAHLRDDFQRHGFASGVCFPMCVDERLVGSMMMFAAVRDFFDEEIIVLVREMVADVCFALKNFQKEAQRCEAEALLRASEEACRLNSRAVEASANGIMISVLQSKGLALSYVNPAFERITGYSAAEVMGWDPLFLMGADKDQIGAQEIFTAIRERIEGSATLSSYRKDGTLFWSDLSIAPVNNGTEGVTHYVGIINDITDGKRYQEQLERQSNEDELTGLANRNRLKERTDLALSFAQNRQCAVAMLYLDLDDFKRINDSLGHAFGDAVLQTVAERISDQMRDCDTAARIGGDDFAILLPDLSGAQDVTAVAQRMLLEIARPIALLDREVNLSASIGISLYPNDGGNYEALLRNADAAMYRAKEAGRNALCFYTDDMNTLALRKLELEAQLRHALERDELLLHYQPLLHLSTNVVTDVEALIRWKTAAGALVSPVDFIPLAEETGLIVPIGRWVLITACKQARQWQREGLNLRVAVNLSARQFRDDQLVHTVREALREADLPGHQLKLEITETVVMHNAEKAARTMAALKELGVGVSMDDFGTGYSSLAYLRRFPLDQLKIDRSFVMDVMVHPDSAAIVHSIIALARNLRMQTVAEGVETPEQRDFLLAAGCDLVQGYLFSSPLPAPQFYEWAVQQRTALLSGGRAAKA